MFCRVRRVERIVEEVDMKSYKNRNDAMARGSIDKVKAPSFGSAVHVRPIFPSKSQTWLDALLVGPTVWIALLAKILSFSFMSFFLKVSPPGDLLLSRGSPFNHTTPRPNMTCQ